MTATVARGSDRAIGSQTRARTQFTNLYRLVVLSTRMFDGRGEEAILRLALTAVPQLGGAPARAGYLIRHDRLVQVGDGADPHPALVERLRALNGSEGAVELPGCGWAWAYPLRNVSGLRGYLVAGADAEPSPEERFLLSVLAQQTGAALGNAMLHRTQREQAGQLRALNAELEGVNGQLSASLAALRQQRRIHEVLSRVSAAGGGEAGIAGAVHELTGLPVAVEDRFGNLRAWAGPGRPHPYPKPSGRRRRQLLERAMRDCRPVRDGDRLIALSRPRHEVLGVLALIDPRRRAGEHEVFALEHGAVILAAELAHQRSLVEVELRMRRDLLDDLLGGATDSSVFSRAEALGHDLHRPHRVVVVSWHSGADDQDVSRAVSKSAAELQLGGLVGQHSGQAVLLAHDSGAGRGLWEELRRRVGRELHSESGAVGVGGRAEIVSDVRRSYGEAQRALTIRRGSVSRDGVTVFDELGVYRVLAAAEDTSEIRAFVREWLGALLDYDDGHRCELVRTLSTYLECGGSYDETAEALTIHRSTLRYRLQRIREVSGLDLADVDCRFNLHVATRAWRVLEGAR